MKRNIIILAILVVGLMALIAIFGEKKVDQPTQPSATSTQTISGSRIISPTSTSSPYHLVDRGNGVIEPVWDYIPAKKVYYITGIYIKTERTFRSNWENEPDQKYICDSFVITSSDEAFINKYKALIQAGSSINRLDEQGRLVMHLDLQHTYQDVAIKIASSTKEITLIVSEKDEDGRDVGPCYSFLQIQDMRK